MINIYQKIIFSFFLILCLFLFLGTTVRAQTCSGGPVKFANKVPTWNCYGCTYTNQYKSDCNGPYVSGVTGKFCVVTSWNCPGSQFLERCSDYTASYYCNNINATATSYECHSGSCTWNPPPPTPTPASCPGGYYCNGTPVTGFHGQTGVCGGGNINYGCNNGSWYSEGTPCYLCAVNGSCGG